MVVGEAATWEEIEDYFVEEKWFRRVYFRGRYAVFDVRPTNCIRTEDGNVVPIDVIPVVCSLAAAKYLSRSIV